MPAFWSASTTNGALWPCVAAETVTSCRNGDGSIRNSDRVSRRANAPLGNPSSGRQEAPHPCTQGGDHPPVVSRVDLPDGPLKQLAIKIRRIQSGLGGLVVGSSSLGPKIQVTHPDAGLVTCSHDVPALIMEQLRKPRIILWDTLKSLTNSRYVRSLLHLVSETALIAVWTDGFGGRTGDGMFRPSNAQAAWQR